MREICYSVGALLYCPANRKSIVNSIIEEQFEKPYSLALCLEDTIKDDRVEEAEQILSQSLHILSKECKQHSFYLPKIFIRVREPQQITKLAERLEDVLSIVTGFIFPKFCPFNADAYIEQMLRLNQLSDHALFMMPILESPTMINLKSRYDVLYAIKEKLDGVKESVLNVRVGGNDLSHVFGFRRHNEETIYQILPIANLLSDIMTVFGTEYILSGPVWEYYDGKGWDTGLQTEIKMDFLNGFIGKTVIHPKQIPFVNRALSVNRADYEDASAILGWDSTKESFVSGSANHERMNEFKTHSNWARRILILSDLYGIR